MFIMEGINMFSSPVGFVSSISQSKKRQDAWYVYLNGNYLDTVYYTPGMSADEVKHGLIEHDGMAPGIVVYLRKH